MKIKISATGALYKMLPPWALYWNKKSCSRGSNTQFTVEAAPAYKLGRALDVVKLETYWSKTVSVDASTAVEDPTADKALTH
jgi:hypothetical protein